MKDPIREKLCEECKTKYDNGKGFYFCEKCLKIFEPKKQNRG